MALDKFTQITKSGIVTTINFECHHLHSTGIATFSAGSITAGGNVTAVDGTFSGNVSVGGTLTYQDVTNIDSVGLVTARTGVKVTAGGIDVTAGVSTFAAAIDANGGVDISGGSGLVASTAKISDLTDNRVVVAGSSGELEDSANLTFDGSNLGVGSKVTVTNANADSRNLNSLGVDINAAWIRLGDKAAAKTFTNGLGIKFHDQGTAHWSTGTIGNQYYVSYTGSAPDELFPSSRVDALTFNTSGAAVFASDITAGGNLYIPDRIYHTGDTDTQIRFPGADAISLETGGSERIRVAAGAAGTCVLLAGNRVDSAHKTLRLTLNHYSFNTVNQINVIGATTGSGYNKVHIGGNDAATGETAATEIKFYTAANATTANGTERLRITSAGNVGINEQSPDNKLHVTTTSSTAYQTNTSNTQNITNALLKLQNLDGSDGGGVNNYVGIQFAVANGATSSAQLNYVRTGDNSGAFQFKARNGNGSVYPNLMTIKSDGKIGINQANPTTALLEIFNSGSAVQGLDVYTNDVGTTAIAKFRGYNNTHGAQDRLIITAKGTLQVNADIANDTDNVAHFQSVHNNKHGSLRVNGHAGTNAVKGIVELIGYAAGGGHGRHAFITASDDGGTYATRMDFKMRETSAWQHTSMTDKLTLHPGHAGTVDVKGIPAHLRLYSQRDTSDWDSTDPIGKLDFYVGDDTSNNLPYNAGFIHCLNETDNANEPSGALVFGTTTANLSGGAIERVRIAAGGQMRVNPPATNGGSTVLAQQALIGTKHIYTAYHNFSSTNSNMNITSIKTNSCGELWIIGGWANGNGLRMKKYTWVASGDTAITEQSNTFASRYGVGITINTPTMSISGDYVHFNFTFSDNQGSKLEKLKIHFEYFYQFKVDS